MAWLSWALAAGRRSGAQRGRSPQVARWLIAIFLVLSELPARAQNLGFQVNRFEPTPSGSVFMRVEHPYYSSAQSWAVGISTLYAHNVVGFAESQGTDSSLLNYRPVIAHQLLGHLDAAGSFGDRVLLGAMLPLLWVEQGQAAFDVAPVSSPTVSDPRLSAMVRLYGQPHKSLWSAHTGVAAWIPLRAISSQLPSHTSDQGARVRLSAVLSGISRAVNWSASLAFHVRSLALLSTRLNPAGASIGSEVELGFAAGFYLPSVRLTVAPEVVFATSLVPTQAFRIPYSSLELLVGARYVVAKRVQLGLGAGIGFLSAAGTPDVRLVFRVAYVAQTRDRDQDGIADEEDACPDQKGSRSEVPSNNGCPAIPDQDCDGVSDSEDECPQTPEGARPDPIRLGCPRTARPPRLSSASQPSS